MLSALLSLLLCFGPFQSQDSDEAKAVEWNQKGVDLLNKGEAEDAISAFHHALQLKSGDHIIRKNLAIAYFQQGQNHLGKKLFDAALSSFRNAVELDRLEGRYPFFVAYTLSQSGKTKEAIVSFERLIEAFPTELDGYPMLGQLYYEEGEFAKSIQVAEKGLAKLTPASDEDKLPPKDKESREQKRQLLKTLLEKAKKDRDVEKNFTPDSSNHFDFLYDGSRREDLLNHAVQIANDLEDAYITVGDHFGVFPQKRFKVIFYDVKEFTETTQADSWVGGFFDGKIRIPVKDFVKEKARIRQVIFHEYTHAVIFTLAPTCPTWLNEGLAQAEEGINLAQAQTRLRATQEKWLSPAELKGSFLKLPGDRARVAYDMSLSLSVFLRDERGRDLLARYLYRLGENKDSEEAIFRSVYGSSFDEIFQTWKERLLP